MVLIAQLSRCLSTREDLIIVRLSSSGAVSTVPLSGLKAVKVKPQSPMETSAIRGRDTEEEEDIKLLIRDRLKEVFWV